MKNKKEKDLKKTSTCQVIKTKENHKMNALSPTHCGTTFWSFYNFKVDVNI